jgi:hypothetical protein
MTATSAACRRISGDARSAFDETAKYAGDHAVTARPTEREGVGDDLARADPQAVTQERTRSMKARLRSLLADLKAFGDLDGTEALDLAQHEDLAKAWRESIDRRFEGGTELVIDGLLLGAGRRRSQRGHRTRDGHEASFPRRRASASYTAMRVSHVANRARPANWSRWL